MDIKKICKSLEYEKYHRDLIDSIYSLEDYFDICNYVINCIPYVDTILYEAKRIPKKHLFNASLDYFNKFDDTYKNKIFDTIHSVKIKKNNELFNAGIDTAFEISFNEGTKIIKTPGYTSKIHLPKRIHDIDIISLGHEYCHMLKDTNLLEHKMMLLNEVIPIFYELINYEDDFLKIKHLQYRLFWINRDTKFYLFFDNELENILNDFSFSSYNCDSDEIMNLYEFYMSSYAKYLYGFYYALILYNLYKKEPFKILNMVRDVLSNEATTRDMLIKLNIYCDIKGDIFEDECKNIIKVLNR